MHPRGSHRELAEIPGNIRSDRFPGGSLISATLDRTVMTWSDRGGASRIFGDLWSEHCYTLLSNGSTNSISTDMKADVLRLDANPKIAIQAGRNKLRNPDFLLLQQPEAKEVHLRAIDAKFAIDRVRRSQISAEAVRDLVELPGSLVRTEIEMRVAGPVDVEQFVFSDGTFLGPHSLLNDFFYEKLTSGPRPTITADELMLVNVDTSQMFANADEAPLMEALRAIDRLNALPDRVEVIAGMYYLRLACAVKWFEEQRRMPLLSASQPNPVPVQDVLEKIHQRVGEHSSAYSLIRAWSTEVETAIDRRATINDAVRLPVRMGEIRKLIQRVGLGDDKKAVRVVRGDLERLYTKKLVERIGEIPSSTRAPVESIVERIHDANRGLRPELRVDATEIVNELAEKASAAD